MAAGWGGVDAAYLLSAAGGTLPIGILRKRQVYQPPATSNLNVADCLSGFVIVSVEV